MQQPYKKKSNSSSLIIGILVAVVLTAAMVIVMLMLADKNKPSDNPESEPTETTAETSAETALPETKEPETAAFETKTPETKAPETTAPETGAPETKELETKEPETKEPETKAPETNPPETKTPETDPILKTGTVLGSGEFVSDASDRIRLIADWELVRTAEGALYMNVRVDLSCYSIYSAYKKDMGRITVGDTTVKYSTDVLNKDDPKLGRIHFASRSFNVSGETQVNVSAEWDMLGTYADVYIGTLKAGGTVNIAELSH